MKTIDNKSLLIGVLLTIIFFITIGSQNNNGNFNEIIAKKLRIVDKNGETVIIGVGDEMFGGSLLTFMNGEISSSIGAGQIQAWNKDGKNSATLGTQDSGNGFIKLYNSEEENILHISNNDSASFMIMGKIGISTSEKGGMINIWGKEGGPLVSITANEGIGTFVTRNKFSEETVYIGTNKYDEGMIGLYDKYGDTFWVKMNK